MKCYINGVLNSQTNLPSILINPNIERLEIGRDAHGAIEWLNGALDNLRIYNRALSAQEILGLYSTECNSLSVALTSDTICSGSNTSLTIQNSQSGISYQPISSGTNYGNPQAGNGNTLTFPINGLMQTTSFTVLATNISTGCSITLDSTFTVYINPLPNNIGQSSTLGSLQNGLVAYYPFNGNANDESGNSNNGTVHGATLTTDRFGNSNSAYSFDGVSNSIYTNLNSGFSNQITVCAWVNTTNNIAWAGIVLNRYGCGALTGLVYQDNGQRMAFYVSDSTIIHGIDGSINVSDGSWHYIVGVFNGNQSSMFIDGVLDITNLFPPTNIDLLGNFLIGLDTCSGYGEHRHFKGKIDDIRIYNRALSSEEIASLYIENCNYLSASLSSDTICSGSNTSLTIQNSQSGISYQLISSGSNFGNPQTGNGNTLTFPINGLSQTTSFTVLATNIATGCSITLDSTFTVYVNSPPANIGQSTGLSPSFQNGLVAFYPFNGNANDESGNGNNGIVHGAALSSDQFGNLNKAYSFDGINNYIEVPDNSSLDFTSFTISAWVKPTAFNTYTKAGGGYAFPDYSGFIAKDSQNPIGQTGFTTAANSTSLRVQGSCSDGSYSDVSITNSVNLNLWQHIVYIFDNGIVKIYKNGVLVVENSANPGKLLSNNNEPVLIGKTYWFPDATLLISYFTGTIDEVRIYNRVLSPIEIGTLFTGYGNTISVSLTDDTICSGSNTSLTIQNSQTGISYQPFSNDSNFGNPQTGNGNVLTFPINGLSQTTSFTILATNIASGCSITLDSTFTVYVNPLPVNIGQSTLLSSLQNGLVGYWPFNGNALDESGNGNNGTVNGAILTTDRLGNTNKAYSFDGINDFINCGNGSSLDIHANISVCAWVNSTTTNTSVPVAKYASPGSSGDAGWELVMANNKIQFDGRDHSNAYISSGSTNVFGSNWHFVVGQRENNIWKIYLDGVLANSHTANSSGDISSSISLEFGRELNSLLYWGDTIHGYWYNGKLDDVRIYNRALSAQEITCLYSGNCNILSASLSSDSICSGSNTSFIIQNSQTGISYQPISSGTNYGNPQTGNGNTLTFPINGLTQTTSFTVLANNIATGCSVTLNSTFTVHVYPLPNNIGPSLQSGLVAYYPFNGNANDESGNGHNGIVNGATLAPDRFGNANSAYYFNSSSIHAAISYLPSFTVSAWFKYNTLSTWYPHVLSLGLECIQFAADGFYGTGKYNSSISYGSTGLGINSDVFVIDNDWHQLITSYDSVTNHAKFYLDNVLLLDTIKDGKVKYFDYLDIGRSNSPCCGYWGGTTMDGSVDDVRIYNRALSPAEVGTLYTGISNTISISLTDDTICSGSNTSLTIQNSQTGISYQPISSGTNFGNPQTGNGNILTYPINGLTQTTSFTILATDIAIGCSITLDSTFTVFVNALPLNIGQSTRLSPSLQTGLVAFYPFNGNANDESGNGNNGVVHATSTSDRYGIAGKAYYFDGIIDSVRVANNFFDIGADSYSIAMWFNIADTIKISQAIFNTEPHAGISFVYNHWSNINHKLLYWLGSGTGTWDIAYGASTNNSLPPSTWKLLTVVKSGSTYTVFFNNQAVDTLTSAITPQHILSGFRFGMNSLWGFPYNDERFNGKLDDIRIYNRALSYDEISCLYNGGCNNLIVGLTSDTICSGSNTSLTIQNSQTGISYQPFSIGSNYGNPLTGNGNTLTFPINGLTQTTSFTVLATSIATGCSVLLDSTFTVQVIPLPGNIGQPTGLNPLQNGLIAYYPFNGNANDESGNGHNGAVNGATLSTDRFGNANTAYSFNGSNNWIQAPGFTISMPSVSECAWFYCNANNPSQNPQLMGIYPPDNYHVMQLETNANNQLFYNASPFGVTLTNSNIWHAGEWHFVCGTYDGVSEKIYFDGVLAANNPRSGNYQITLQNLIIGRQNNPIGSYWNGKLDEIRIYNRALTPDEIICLYNNTCIGGNLLVLLSPDSICSGSNTSLIIQNSQTGISYQLLSNGSNYGNPQTGNGNTLTFPINGLTQTTSFTILATNPATNCSVTLDSTYTVNLYPAVTASVYANVTICSGSSTTLTASGGSGYLWSNGTTTSSNIVSPLTTTVYYVTVTNLMGCSDTASVTVVVTPALPVSVSLTASATTVCAGDTVHFTAHTINPGSNATLQWYVNGVQVSNSNITNGLIAYYPFNGNANDYSGNNNNAAVVTATPTADRFGNPNSAYNFAGISNPQIIRVPNSPSLQFTNQATFSLWVKMNSYYGMNGYGQTVTNGVHMLFSKDYDQCCLYEGIVGFPNGEFNAGGCTNGWYSGINSGDTVSGSSIGQWYNLTFVYTPTQGKIYANGQLITTKSGVTTFANSNSKDLYFGRLNSFWYPLNGKLDEVRFYNRALSDTEVLQLYQGNDSTFSYIPQNGDVVTCVLTATGTCLSNNPATSNAITMTVNPLPVPVINGASTVCSGAIGNVYSTETGMTNYSWGISSGGTISSGTGTNSITVTWSTTGAQTVSVIYTNANACTAASATVYNVTVNPMVAPVLNGPATICATVSGNIYTTQAGMNNYIWSVSPGGTITSGGTPTSNTITITWNTSGTKTVSVNYTNPSGCTAATPSVFNVTVNPIPVPSITGLAIVCNGSSGITYTTETGMSAYIWSISAGGTITAGAGTSTITVNWNSIGNQTLTVNYSNLSGCSATTATVKAVTVNPMAAPTLTGPISLCQGTTGNIYTTQAGMNNYIWSVSSGGTITSGGTPTNNTITITWNTSGSKTVSVNYTNSSGCTAATPSVFNVYVNPIPVPTITGLATVCNGSTGITYTTETGMSAYIWSISAGGTITAGAGTNTITVTWNALGAQTVSVNYANANACLAAMPTVKTVTVNPMAAPTLTGPISLCQGTTGNIYTTEPGMNSYLWTVSPGGIITAGGTTSSNTVTVSWSVPGPQSVSVNYTNVTGCTAMSATSTSVTVAPFIVPTISGPNSACLITGNYIYTTETGMIGYTWGISTGGTIVGGLGTNSVTVHWITAGNHTLSVNYTNAGGCSPISPTVFNVSIYSKPVPFIAGLGYLCVNSGFNYFYSTEEGMTNYQWTVSPGGTIISGANTNLLTVTWNLPGEQWVSVNYTNNGGCTASVPSKFGVTVKPLPGSAGSITGLSTVCAGALGVAYSIPPIANATSYTWSLPIGASIATGNGTNSISVNFSMAATSGNISVFGTNDCGNGSVSVNFPITINQAPNAAGAISGTSMVCQGQNGVSYSVASIPLATGYQWTYSGTGVTFGNSTTNSITINFGPNATSGILTVSGFNSCGNGISSINYPITINPLPSAAGPIAGASNVCQGQNGVAFSVAAIPLVTSYLWSYSGIGATINNAVTNSISVDFAANATSGNLTVRGVNACGNGVSSALYPISVKLLTVANAGIDKSIANGTSTTLSGSANGGSGLYSWHWEPANLLLNADVQNPTTVNLISSTLFTLTVSDGFSCSASDGVFVNVLNPLSVSVYSSDDTVCAGTIVQLSISTGGGSGNYNFSWTSEPAGFVSSLQNPTVSPSITTAYMVLIDDGFSSTYGYVTVVAKPFPSIPAMPVGQDTIDLRITQTSTYIITGSQNALAYIWELIPSSAGSISGNGTTGIVEWNPNYRGEAFVKVKAVNTCGQSIFSDEKQVMVLNSTGIVENELFNIVVYPNPNDGTFAIKSPETINKVIIMDALGKTIDEVKAPKPEHRYEYKLAEGVYLVHVYIGEAEYVRKIVVKKGW